MFLTKTGERLFEEIPAKVELPNRKMEVLETYEDISLKAGEINELPPVTIEGFDEFFIQYFPNGLNDYTIYIFPYNVITGGILTRETLVERNSSRNGSTGRFTVDAMRMRIGIMSNTDHQFGSIALVGVRKGV